MKANKRKTAKRRFAINNPPPVLAGARVLAFALVDRSVTFKNSGLLLVDGKPLGSVPRLAICESEDDSLLLMFCDKKWTPIGLVGCASLSEAKKRAEQDYEGISRKWVKMLVTKQAAKKYLEGLYRDQCCMFCGRSPLEVDRMISSAEARICDKCVGEFAESIRHGRDIG